MNIRAYLVTLLTGLLMVTQAADEAAAGRSQLDLSGQWLFCPDRGNAGIAARWFEEGFDTSSWRRVSVPIAFDDCGPDMDRYIGAGWFRRTFSAPKAMIGQRAVIRFEGINYNASVWLNGKLVGENHDPFLPFEVPVSDFLRYKPQLNMIVVRIDNIRSRGQFPPFESWFGQGGFLREAKLVATNRVHLSHLAITAEPNVQGGRFALNAHAANKSSKTASLAIRVTVRDSGGNQLAELSSDSANLVSGGGATVAVEGSIRGAQPWDPEHPVLYTAQVDLLSAGRGVDRLKTRFGFRRVEVRDARILLNGKPVFLKGFNRHEDSPRTGMAVDLRQASADFLDMKRMGCNFVRLCAYAHHPGVVELCDELGLLVKTENILNGWGWDPPDHPDPGGGFLLPSEDTPMMVANGKRILGKMVLEYMNHPSIILCCVANEPVDKRADIAEGLSQLVEYGKRLDSTRLWLHVSCYWASDYTPAMFKSDDVIGINAYPTMLTPVDKDRLAAKLPDSTRWMKDKTAMLHRDFPDKPILVTEFGYPLVSGEEAQAIAVEAEFAGLTAPYIAGAALWCYAQHPWPENAFYAGGKKISPYGYISRDRKTRYKAMSVIERLFKESATR